MAPPSRPSRRNFLKSAATAAAVPAAALTGCAGDEGPPPRLHLTLRNSPVEAGTARVIIDGRTYPLQPQTEDSLATFVREQPASAGGPRMLMPTHFLDGVALPRDAAMRIHATVRKPGGAANDHRLALVHISVPPTRLSSELARVRELRTRMGLTGARAAAGLPGPELLVARYAESPTPVSTAVALVFHHPELMSFQGESATTVIAHIHASPYLVELASMIALQPGTDGDDASWCLAVAVIDDQTGQPFLDGDGAIVYDYQPTPDILELLEPVVLDVLQAVKNDEALRGTHWSVSEGVASREIQAPLTTGALGATGGYRLSQSIAPNQRTEGVTVDASIIDGANRRVEVRMTNDLLRFVSVWVSFKNRQGDRIAVTDLFGNTVDSDSIADYAATQKSLAAALSRTGRQLTTMTTLLSPTSTFLGFPVRDARAITKFNMPADAVSVQVNLGSAGQGVFGGDMTQFEEEIVGFAVTVVCGYAVPSVTLLMAGGSTTNQDLIDVLKKEPAIWLDILSTLKNVVIPGLTDGDWRRAGNGGIRLLLNLADRIAKLLLNRAFVVLYAWLIKKIVLENALKAIPFVGWGLRVATVAGNIQQITRTTIDVASNKSHFSNTLSLSMDIALTINRDLDSFSFPASATHYEVQLVIPGATGFKSGLKPVPQPGQSGPIAYTITDVPSGGTGTVNVAFYGPNGLITGAGNAARYTITATALQAMAVATDKFAAVPQDVITRLQPLVGRTYANTPALVADLRSTLGVGTSETWRKTIAARLAEIDIALLLGEGSTLELECTIQEQLVPLTASTRYAHQRVLRYSGGRYDWQATPLPRAANPLTCDNSANALCQLGGITLAQRSGQLGYAWRSASAGLPVCGGGVSGTQAWTVQNISLQDDPNTALRSLRMNGARCGIVEGAGIVYQFDGPSDGSGANFLLDGRGGAIQVRPIDNASPDSLELSGMTVSFGAFSSLPTAVAWHFAGYLIGVNAETHKIEIVDLNRAPIEDALAPSAKIAAGLGVRDGLLLGPTCVACTLDGKVLVLESIAGRVQAFDVHAEPVHCFAAGSATFPLRQQGQAVRYLDMGVDVSGHVFVLVQSGNGTQVSHFDLDIYTPDGKFLCSTNGFSAARMAIDLWRNVYSLNWETLQGRDGRTEPTVSRWVPN